MKLLIDLDDVIADLAGAVLRLHAERRNPPHMNREKLTGGRLAPAYWDSIKAFYRDPSAYLERVKPMPGVGPALDAIAQRHMIIIVSSWSCEDKTERKRAWMERYLPAHADKLYGTPKGTKARWPADVMIDDLQENIGPYQKAHPTAVTVVIDQPWNKDATADLRWPGITHGQGGHGWPGLATWLSTL